MESLEGIEEELNELSKEVESLQTNWRLDVAKDTTGKYVVLFTGNEGNCKHTKHITKMNDYTFLFCSKTKNPIAIYTGSEVNTSDSAIQFVTALTTTQTLLHDLIPDDNAFSSVYFDSLSKAIFNVKDISFTTE